MGLPTLFLSVLISIAQTTAMVAADAPVPPPAASEREPTFAWIPKNPPVPSLVMAGDLSGFIGERVLSGDAWRHLPPAFQVGVQMTLGSRQWWVRPMIGYYHANETGDYHDSGTADLNLGLLGTYREAEARGQLTTTVDEVDVGVGRDWQWWRLRLEGASGAGWVHVSMEDRPAVTPFRVFAKVDTNPRSDQGQTIAWWGSVGVSMQIGNAHAGVLARYTYAPVKIFDQDLQAGGWQVGAQVGWQW